MSTLQLELSPLSDLVKVIGEVIQDENLTQHSADILSAKACILRIAKNKQVHLFCFCDILQHCEGIRLLLASVNRNT